MKIITTLLSSVQQPEKHTNINTQCVVTLWLLDPLAFGHKAFLIALGPPMGSCRTYLLPHDQLLYPHITTPLNGFTVFGSLKFKWRVISNWKKCCIRILKILILAIYCTFVMWVNGGSTPPVGVRWSLWMISATHPCIIDCWRKPISKQTRLGFSTVPYMVSTHANPNIHNESYLLIYYLPEVLKRNKT